MRSSAPLVVDNAWQQLRQFTAARIALGRSGVSQPTRSHLAFQLAHAQARDAVHLGLDVTRLASELDCLDCAGSGGAAACVVLESAAPDRLTYLQRPDLGRRLSDASRDRLRAHADAGQACDVAFVIADGLSARAVAQHAAPLMHAVLRNLARDGCHLAPITVVTQARVAIGDEVGQLLRAKLVVLLIGERPGLSSPDSLGVYMTWMPRIGLTDASRNCISNIRPEGLPVKAAAIKVNYLMREMKSRELSGVALKDESKAEILNEPTGHARVANASSRNFLLGPPR